MYSPLKHGDVLNCHSSQLRLKRALKEKLQPAWSNPTCNGQHLDSADHMAGLALLDSLNPHNNSMRRYYY